MAEALLDVHLEFDPGYLADQYDPTRTIAEASHHAATEKARDAGGTLRHPDPREVVAETAIDPTTGRDVLLVATRWVVDTRGPSPA